MKLIFGAAGAGLIVSVMLGMLLGPHYRSAVQKQVKDRVISSISPETHAEAARQALVSAEDKLVSAIQHSQRQLSKLDDYRKELRETEAVRSDCAKRLMQAKEALQAGGMDASSIQLLAGEVKLLKTAHDEAMARETKLREHVNSAASKHDQLRLQCEGLMGQIEAKKLALSQSVSRAQADQADLLLHDAEEIVSSMETHAAFGREAREILASLKSPPMRAPDGSASAEMLMAEIDQSLGSGR